MNAFIRRIQMLVIVGAGIWLVACGDTPAVHTLSPTTIQATPHASTNTQNLTTQGTPTMLPSSGGKPSSPFIAHLEPVVLNPLNQVSTLVFSATARTWDAPNTLVTFELPPNIVLITGVLTQRSDFRADVPQTFTFQIKPTVVGEYMIEARVYYQGQDGGAYGGADGFYLNVNENETTIFYEKLSTLPPCEWPMLAEQAGITPTPCR